MIIINNSINDNNHNNNNNRNKLHTIHTTSHYTNNNVAPQRGVEAFFQNEVTRQTTHTTIEAALDK